MSYELCLTGDTPIRMESGESKPIRDLVGHDFTVMARNYVHANEAGINATATACNVRKTGEATTLVAITVELPETEGERIATIRCTMEHLFLVQSAFYSDPRPHWQSASMLVAGDYLAGDIYRSLHSTMAVSMKILSVGVEMLNEPIDVYDMEVPVLHNFPIAVGNTCVIYSHNCAADMAVRLILPPNGKE